MKNNKNLNQLKIQEFQLEKKLQICKDLKITREKGVEKIKVLLKDFKKDSSCPKLKNSLIYDLWVKKEEMSFWAQNWKKTHTILKNVRKEKEKVEKELDQINIFDIGFF